LKVKHGRQEYSVIPIGQIYSQLMDEPFFYRIHEIANLTDYQIYTLIIGDRNNKGEKKTLETKNKVRKVRDLEKEKQIFFTTGQLFKIPISVLEKQWEEQNGN